MLVITFPKVTILLIATITLSSLSAEGRLEEHGTARRFISDKYGFSIDVPRGWLVDPSGDTPIYFSFSPSETSFIQMKLPKGGAVISIVALESLPGYHPGGKLSERASEDARGVSARKPLISPFEMPREGDVESAIISSYDSAAFGPDDHSQHRVNVFFKFHHKDFAAHLLYLVHDSKGSTHEKSFLETIRSIRPLL